MKTSVLAVLAVWLLIMTVVGFFSMGLDKRRARHRRHRIPERYLFLLAVLGGSLGILLGMKFYRHKTKHNGFRYGMPGLLLGQMALGMYIGLLNVL